MHERPVDLIEPPENLLASREVENPDLRQIASNLFQIGGLTKVRDGLPIAPPRQQSMLKGAVVELLPCMKQAVKGLLLCLVRIQAVLVSAFHLCLRLGLNITLDCFRRNVPCRTDVIASSPELSFDFAFKRRELLAEPASCRPLECICQPSRRASRRSRDKKVNVIGHNLYIEHCQRILSRNAMNQLDQAFPNRVNQYGAAILRCPYQVIVQIIDRIARLTRLLNLSIHAGGEKVNGFSPGGLRPIPLAR